MWKEIQNIIIFPFDFLKLFILFLFISFIFIDFFINYHLIRPFYEMTKLEEYLRICSTNSLIKNDSFKKINNPKFSIITPILNKCLTLKRYIRSIQNQTFKNIEIIFIDDHSNDNTIKIIENMQKEDKRIILLKNKKRKGTLMTKNIGVYKSKGEFLLFVDPDDIISENIIVF